MIIRKAKMSDTSRLDELLTLLIREEKKYNNDVLDSIWIIGAYEEFIDDKEKCLLVAEEDGIIIGYIYGVLNQKDLEVSKSILLDALYIVDEYRNKGIANQLIDELKAWAKENNAKYIEVNVISENIEAKKLYTKYSFKTYNETMRYMMDGE